eukprot:1178124-Pyramimonas_sp.AAC.1
MPSGCARVVCRFTIRKLRTPPAQACYRFSTTRSPLPDLCDGASRWSRKVELLKKICQAKMVEEPVEF